MTPMAKGSLLSPETACQHSSRDRADRPRVRTRRPDAQRADADRLAHRRRWRRGWPPARAGSWPGLLVAFGAVFDLFDGALARATGTDVSKFGAFLDSTLDRAGEAVVYVGIAVRGATRPDPARLRVAPSLAVAAMAAAFMVSYARAKSESLGFCPGTGMANVGLAPREVRIAILTVGLILIGLAADRGHCVYLSRDHAPVSASAWIRPHVARWPARLIAVLATITTIQRILSVRAQSSVTNAVGGQSLTMAKNEHAATATAARPAPRTARSASPSSASATAPAASSRAATTTRTPAGRLRPRA